MNSIDRLVQMANQIAVNLAREPDPAAAMAEHIHLYWDPRMKQGIATCPEQDLTEIARAAVRLLGDGGPGLSQGAPAAAL